LDARPAGPEQPEEQPEKFKNHLEQDGTALVEAS
jgi:hypothetical protein